jgi:hypothetical protein
VKLVTVVVKAERLHATVLRVNQSVLSHAAALVKVSFVVSVAPEHDFDDQIRCAHYNALCLVQDKISFFGNVK